MAEVKKKRNKAVKMKMSALDRLNIFLTLKKAWDKANWSETVLLGPDISMTEI